MTPNFVLHLARGTIDGIILPSTLKAKVRATAREAWADGYIGVAGISEGIFLFKPTANVRKLLNKANFTWREWRKFSKMWAMTEVWYE